MLSLGVLSKMSRDFQEPVVLQVRVGSALHSHEDLHVPILHILILSPLSLSIDRVTGEVGQQIQDAIF